jgi:hypothetical protein
MNAYHYVGTYSDGVQRSGIIHTNDVSAWVKRMTTGFLPFQRIDLMACDNTWVCDHHLPVK